MPNHCANCLIIHGETKEVKKFISENTNSLGKLSFERLLPTPADLLEKKDLSQNWYAWRLIHWGTKWDAYDTDQDVTPDLLANGYYFTTANNPPDAWVTEIILRFPTLIIELAYCETGNYFAGKILSLDGKPVTLDYDLDSTEGQEFAYNYFGYELNNEE